MTNKRSSDCLKSGDLIIITQAPIPISLSDKIKALFFNSHQITTTMHFTDHKNNSLNIPAYGIENELSTITETGALVRFFQGATKLQLELVVTYIEGKTKTTKLRVK